MSANDPKRTRRAFPSASLSRYDAVSCGKWLELLKAKAARTPAVPGSPSHKKGGKRLQQLAATLNRSQRDWGVEGERSVVNQPRVTTGGGALPFPTGALPTHPLTPMARTIEQTAIRNFFMGPPFM